MFFRKPFIKLTPTAARARDVDCTTLIVVGRSRFSGSPESLSLSAPRIQIPISRRLDRLKRVYTHGPSVCVYGLRAYAAECRAGTLFLGAAERKRRTDGRTQIAPPTRTVPPEERGVGRSYGTVIVLSLRRIRDCTTYNFVGPFVPV